MWLLYQTISWRASCEHCEALWRSARLGVPHPADPVGGDAIYARNLVKLELARSDECEIGRIDVDRMPQTDAVISAAAIDSDDRHRFGSGRRSGHGRQRRQPKERQKRSTIHDRTSADSVGDAAEEERRYAAIAQPKNRI